MTGKVPVVVFNDTRADHHHGCVRVMAALESLLSDNQCTVLLSVPAHADWQGDTRVLEAISKARLLVVNGEGTIHHNSVAGMRLLAVADQAALYRIPAVLVNCAWQENAPAFAERLRGFALVAARDSRSAAEICAAGIQCRMVPDLSLYLPCVPMNSARHGVGFTDSVLREVSLVIENARKQCSGKVLPIQYVEPGILSSYRYFREYLGKRDVFRPGFVLRLLRLRWHHYQKQSADTAAFLSELGSLELLVSGRFHACTLALVTNTPFLAVSSNSHKIEALVEDAGLASWRLVGAVRPGIVELARQKGWEPEERKHLADYLAYARESAKTLFRDVGRLL